MNYVHSQPVKKSIFALITIDRALNKHLKGCFIKKDGEDDPLID